MPDTETAAVPRFRRSDEIVLHSLVGSATMARGRAYAQARRVEAVEWDASGLRVAGQVRGSAEEPYSVRVNLTRRPDGRMRSVTGECSCPVGWNCKHVVATLLSPARSEPSRPQIAPLRPCLDKPIRSRPIADWAAPFEALVSSGHSTDPDEHDCGDPAFGLQFELVVARARPGRQPAAPGIRLRPVTLGDRGHWIRTGVSWRGLDYVHGWRTLHRSRPLELLCELRALARVGDRPQWVASGEEAMWLEDFQSRRVWDLLAEACSAGLALVPAARNAGSIAVSAMPATAVLDVVRDPAGSLSIRAGLRPPGSECAVAPDRCVLVGRPAHGAVWWDPDPEDGGTGAVHLGALDSQLPDAIAALIASGERLTVPEKGVARFEVELYPALRRRVAMTSHDGSFPLPEVEADRVRCQITHLPGPALDVAWALTAGTTAARPVTEEPDPGAEKILGEIVDIVGWRDGLLATTSSGPVLVGGRLAALPAARFVTLTVPALAAIDGVDVVQIGDPPDYREVTDTPQIRLTGGPAGGGNDWLDLAVEVTVGGEPVPFEELFVAMVEGAQHLLLPSGAYFSLDRDELRQLAELIAEARSLHDPPPGRVRLSRFSASLYDDLALIADIGGGGGAAWQHPLRALTESAGVARPAPAGLVAELRPYQLEGFRWLVDRFENRLGAVLADDMGLGKTLQALALVCHVRHHEPEAGPWLVVAPTSVVGGWEGEARRFAPHLGTAAITETTRRRGTSLTSAVGGSDLVITSYALFRLDHEEYEAERWAGLILDEAQFVKNPASRAAQLARGLPCDWKLAMTGTPLENSLSELWSLLTVTCPGLLGRLDRFETAYRQPIERRDDTECLERLRRRVRPVMLRRAKTEVLADLPDKQEQTVELDLEPRHRKLYQTYLQRERQKVLGLIGDMKSNRFEILRSLTTLRQAALDVSLVDAAHRSVPSVKLDHLDALLGEAVADGHRVLVFSQFTRFLTEARRRTDAAGIPNCYLDGRTRKRAEVIERFRAEEVPVFFISLKAGGFGLNLTEADHAVLLDPWWNPATEAQAVDRVHRIGQTRKVMVHRLVARDTIEEKVMTLKQRKAALFDAVMGGGGFSSSVISAADVEELLA